jgi:hypothetical protein
VDLTIVDTTSNTTEQVSVPATVATGRIIGRLLELWQLPDVGRDGQPLSYRFDHSKGGREISVEETLADAGVRDNDVLHLIATPTQPGSSHGTERPASLPAETPVGSLPPTAVLGAPPTTTPASGDGRTAQGARAAALPGRTAPGLYRLALAIGALAAVGIGVLFATGALSGGSRASVRSIPAQVTGGSATVPTPPTQVGPTESERAHDRRLIMALLASYREDYSIHDLAALSGLFTSGVTRHGLAAGGCRVSQGRSAVIASYQSQFDKGSGVYSLVGLSAAQIRLDTTTQAHLNTHYRITPGGTGYVDFKFADAGEGWKISEVYATCA